MSYELTEITDLGLPISASVEGLLSDYRDLDDFVHLPFGRTEIYLSFPKIPEKVLSRDCCRVLHSYT